MPQVGPPQEQVRLEESESVARVLQTARSPKALSSRVERDRALMPLTPPHARTAFSAPSTRNTSECVYARSAVPRGTIHCTGWLVTDAIKSNSWS